MGYYYTVVEQKEGERERDEEESGSVLEDILSVEVDPHDKQKEEEAGKRRGEHIDKLHRRYEVEVVGYQLHILVADSLWNIVD